MSWEAILVLALFVLPPLLKLFAEGGTQAPPGPGDTGNGAGAPARPAVRRQPPRAEPMQPAAVAPWEGLVRTPAPHLGAEPEGDFVVSLEEFEEFEEFEVVEALESVDPRPAPVDADPDRESEHARFHRRLAASAPPARTAAQNRLRLGGRSEIRRAVVLSEVLGPPRALRPLGEDDR